MTNYRASKWACQYHVVFIRRSTVRRHLGGVLVARQRESEWRKGICWPTTMLVVSAEVRGGQVIGYMKGKSAIHIAREFAGRSRSFVGQHFWARGYSSCLRWVGTSERFARISAQEQEDRHKSNFDLPVPGTVPFNTLPWAPHIHLAIVVHRVDDLAAGEPAMALT